MEMDKLEHMFTLQKEFHELVGPSLKAPLLTSEYRQKMLADTLRNIIVESVETMQEINWKPWKKTKKEVEWQKVEEELADIFIFLMNGVLEVKLTPIDFYHTVLLKIEKNIKRQKEGY